MQTSIASKDVLPVILYVDDQPSHRALFQRAFQSKYKVLTASSGEEALDIVKNQEIFLVIADHNMPGMSGVDFLEKSEKLLPKAKRAILSAYLDDAIVKEATQRVKLDAQLAKPWKLEGMRGFIEKAYEKYAVPVSDSTVDIPQTELITDDLPITSLHLSHVADMLSESVDKQGARRIFLSFVEPKLKAHFPLIRRPYPDRLQQAQQAALRGNIEAVQMHLAEYLQDQGIENILADYSELPKKKFH